MGEPAPCAFEGVTIRYGRNEVCRDISLSVQKGDVYALLGRNGAGKSSLIRCLLGQQRVTAGRALLFGADAWRGRARAMARTGVVPERPDAPVSMSARQLSRFCRPLYPRWDEGALLERLSRASVPTDEAFGKLSRGQQQQVMLVLALGHGPELLVLDDPTLGLDVVARRGLIEELVGELADRGTTVLIATHDLVRFEGVATRVGVLCGGDLLLDGELEGLKARFRRVRVRSGDHQALARLDSHPGTLRTARFDWGAEWICDGEHEDLVATIRESIADARTDLSDLALEEIFEVITADAERGSG